MLAAVVHQRLTGPTYPKRGIIDVAGEMHRYKLVRSESSTKDARVVLPRPSSDVSATLNYRRYKSGDAFTAAPMSPEGEVLVAPLPKQPAAGKLEYYLDVTLPHRDLRIPEASEDNIIIRYKDDVPALVLVPHIVFMFFSVLIGMRAGLAALFGLRDMRPLAWVALGGMTIGGMTLGPIVQKYAFGAFWTGFPFGYDLTDNKTLIMWLVWLIAVLAIGFRARPRAGLGRAVVVVAAIVMTVVYLIPHSMRGSELDYSKLEEGVPASGAIGTGD
jgi:hypothetical protein